jgi:uncharacterized protein YecT (DUF1311 family)
VFKPPKSPVLSLAILVSLSASAISAPSFKDETVVESEKVGDITVYCCSTSQGDKYVPDVFVEDNKTNDVQLLYSGFNSGISALSEDARWLIICDAARMMGGIWVFEREKGALYQEVEKDLTLRAIAFEKAKGLRPPKGAEVVKELFGCPAEMIDPHRILFKDTCRLTDDSSFQTGVVYDFETRSFAIPTAEQKARMEQPDFGRSAALVINSNVAQASSTPVQQEIVPGREYVQSDCYGLRYYADVPLFLSIENDSDALEKLVQTGRLKRLIETQEVEVVVQDATGQFKQVREPGEIEMFYVPATDLGPIKPQGPSADIAARELSLLRPIEILRSYIAKMRQAEGPNTLRQIVNEMHRSLGQGLDALKAIEPNIDKGLKAAEYDYELLCQRDQQTEGVIAAAEVAASQWELQLTEWEKPIFEQTLAAYKLAQQGQDPKLAYVNSRDRKKRGTETSRTASDSGTEAALNAIWKKLSSQQRVKLRDEERAWIKERDKLKNDPAAFLKATEDRIETLKAYAPSS